MERSKNRKLLRALFTAAVMGVGGAALAQAAEQLYVNRAALPIREGKGGAYNAVATAKQGDALTVIAREDNWIKVQFGDKQGYVNANSLSAKQIKGSGFGNALAGGADAGGLEAGAAGKGLLDDAEKYAKSKGMSAKIVDDMIDRNNAVSIPDWEAFQKEGNVGANRKK
jgi:uncharacterized protein YgiM (DUF1202 family)